MSERRYTKYDLVVMDRAELKWIETCLRLNTLRLMGIPWKTWASWTVDPVTEDLVITWE